jgi:hypothetical protein
MKKETLTMKQEQKGTTLPKVVKPFTVDTLPSLPSEITTTVWYQNSVNNTQLTNVGGDNWKMTLYECLNHKTGKYDIEVIKTKIDILTQFGKRPPKSEGVGGKGEDYSQNMIDLTVEIDKLVNKTSEGKCYTGKSGKFYRLHKFFREYVVVNGKTVMLTTVKKGTTYTDGTGTEHTK